MHRALLPIAVLCVCAALPTPGSAAGTLSFTDIGSSVPDTIGGHGAMFADVDDDGLPDLYLPLNYGNLSLPDLFLRNDGGAQLFEDGAARGIDDFDAGSHGAAWADLDNDGDYDLVNGTTYSLDSIPAWNNVFENDGTGHFTDVTPASMQVEELTRALLSFDLDGDGDLDLFGVTNYRGSGDPPGETNEVYRNDGGFQFTSIAAGDLAWAPVGQGATDTDFDGDGDVDVFAANRGGAVGVLRNDGSSVFTWILPSWLGITHEAGDGITTADIDNDDDLDLLLASDDSAHVYRNDGAATFSFRTTFTGTGGYMGGFADLDNDGDLDLVFAGAPTCHLNDGTGTFTAGPPVPVAGLRDPRAVAFADLEGDGDLDFAIGVKNTRSMLIRNDHDAGQWLKVRLISPTGQAGAFGAKTRVYAAGDAGGQVLALRESRSNHGYLAQDDPVLHFGLGARTQVDVVVTFLGGATVTVPAVAANQTITVDGRAGLAAAVPPANLGPVLERSVPNPFSASTAVGWRTPMPSDVDLAVFDALGRRIRTLERGPRPGGRCIAVWDGRDDDGRRVAGGVYFFRLRAGELSAARAVIRLR